MKVKSHIVEPIQRPDGSWTTVLKEFEEDIPDLGRESIFCNKCGWSTYPQCKEWCNNWKPPRSLKNEKQTI